jgi:hypothetical protein
VPARVQGRARLRTSVARTGCSISHAPVPGPGRLVHVRAFSVTADAAAAIAAAVVRGSQLYSVYRRESAECCCPTSHNLHWTALVSTIAADYIDRDLGGSQEEQLRSDTDICDSQIARDILRIQVVDTATEGPGEGLKYAKESC